MKAWIILGLALAAGPAFGQKVYKCPGPDGKAVYQQQRCPEGERMIVRDNGSSGGGTPESAAPPPAQPGRSASSVPESGLRESEKEMLRDVRQREADDADRRAEYAKARAIEAHQQEVRKMSEQMHQDNMIRLELLKESLRRK